MHKTHCKIEKQTNLGPKNEGKYWRNDFKTFNAESNISLTTLYLIGRCGEGNPVCPPAGDIPPIK